MPGGEFFKYQAHTAGAGHTRPAPLLVQHFERAIVQHGSGLIVRVFGADDHAEDPGERGAFKHVIYLGRRAILTTPSGKIRASA